MRLQDAIAFQINASNKSFRFVAATLSIAFAYVLTGKLAVLLALPPGYATAIFPPAGIAVGVAFVIGRPSLLGIFLGSFALNLWVSYSTPRLIYPPAYIAAALIASASTLQAGIGGWLLRRQLGYPCAFDRARTINLFLLLTPSICLISATVSVASLLALGLVNSAHAPANWLTWWLGDTMGVLIVLPIVMVAIGQPRLLWRKRKFVITVPLSIAVAFFVFAFLQAARWEELESLNYLRTQVGWQSWTVLTFGLFGTGLLGALLMLSSGHAARVEAEVEQKTQALRVSEERWQFALEGAGDGVWDVDLRSNEMFLSARNMAMLGYADEPRRMSVDEWKQSMHPDDVEHAREIILKYLKGETSSYIFDFRTLTREGQWRWLRSRGKLIAAQADGTPARLIGTHTDIESEKHSQLMERLHNDVMEMLVSAHGNHQLADVLEKITSALHETNTELAYAVFTSNPTHLSMSAGNDVLADLRTHEFSFVTHAQSGGNAFQAGKIVRISSPDNIFSQQLEALSNSNGYPLCWIELLKAQDNTINGALVVFKCKPNSHALPDLDHLRHAARLIELAIQRKYVEENLLLAASVYGASSEAIMVMDADKRIVAINPAFTTITGFYAEDVIGRSSKIFRADKDAEAFDDIMEQVDKTGFWKGEFWSYRKTGAVFFVASSMNTLYDDDGNIFRHICVFSDITDKKIAEEKLQHLASHDTLTGLPNRMLFRDRLQQALTFAQREKNRFALMYIDLDHFKPVNDNLGHLVGDQLLLAVAERMQACVRESDTVARVGGDEFVVLLPTFKLAEDAWSVAEKIRTSLNETFEINNHLINISASIGIAIYPEDGDTEHDLALSADRAMYLAKQRGRDAIQTCRDTTHEKT